LERWPRVRDQLLQVLAVLDQRIMDAHTRDRIRAGSGRAQKELEVRISRGVFIVCSAKKASRDGTSPPEEPFSSLERVESFLTVVSTA
jgi:hypothetical protein